MAFYFASLPYIFRSPDSFSAIIAAAYFCGFGTAFMVREQRNKQRRILSYAEPASLVKHGLRFHQTQLEQGSRHKQAKPAEVNNTKAEVGTVSPTTTNSTATNTPVHATDLCAHISDSSLLPTLPSTDQLLTRIERQVAFPSLRSHNSELLSLALPENGSIVDSKDTAKSGGSYNTIRCAHLAGTGQAVIVRTRRDRKLDHGTARRCAENALRASVSLAGPAVFDAVITKDGHLQLVMEKFDTDLFDYLSSLPKSRRTLAALEPLSFSVVSAVSALAHSARLVSGDIKPSNMVLRCKNKYDSPFDVRIIDFDSEFCASIRNCMNLPGVAAALYKLRMSGGGETFPDDVAVCKEETDQDMLETVAVDSMLFILSLHLRKMRMNFLAPLLANTVLKRMRVPAARALYIALFTAPIFDQIICEYFLAEKLRKNYPDDDTSYTLCVIDNIDSLIDCAAEFTAL